jgi:hypothetical protein
MAGDTIASHSAEKLSDSTTKLGAFLNARFNEKRMSEHSRELEYAGKLLSDSYETARVISSIANLIRANQLASAFDEDVLNQNDEDCLLSAINLLADGMSNRLCNAADKMDRDLGTQKGGV